MNLEDAKSIMREIDSAIDSENYQYDFLSKVKSISIDDGEFWYYMTRVLRKLPESDEMDLRENGAIAAGVFASEKCFSISPESAGVIAERILVLEMYVHGLSAISNSGKSYISLFNEQREQLSNILEYAVKKFPSDEWFKEQKNDFEESF